MTEEELREKIAEWDQKYYREKQEHEKDVERLQKQIEELTEMVVKLRLEINTLDRARFTAGGQL